MGLAEGTKLGTYEVVGALGAGGMGEVYRARDTRLGRAVALKVLPEAFRFDPDRVSRFEREAKVLASLNHSHIAALYGAEEADGRHFLVMELVQGDTLADWLRRGPIPRAYEYPRVSPDGSRIAVATDDGNEAIVWIYEVSGTSALRRLTFGIIRSGLTTAESSFSFLGSALWRW